MQELPCFSEYMFSYMPFSVLNFIKESLQIVMGYTCNGSNMCTLLYWVPHKNITNFESNLFSQTLVFLSIFFSKLLNIFT